MAYAKNVIPIEANKVYHIYNRAIANDILFKNDSDYLKFISYCKKFLVLQSSIYAYSLLPNHFHFLLGIGNNAELFSKPIADTCNGYARWFNTKYNRSGSLFITPFKRNEIKDDIARAWITWYIHRNPSIIISLKIGNNGNGHLIELIFQIAQHCYKENTLLNFLEAGRN